MSIEKGSSKKKINDLLRAATEENERARTYEHTIVSQITGKSPTSTAPEKNPAPEENPDSPEKTAVDIETEAIIGKYSTRVQEAAPSSTAELKLQLERQAATDGGLAVVPKAEARRPSRKAEELREMLTDAKTRTISDAERIPGVPSDARNTRFSELQPGARPVAPVQEAMFDLEDEPDLTQTREIVTTKFDEDYEALSSRIVSGELDLVGDPEEDAGQVVMEEEPEDLVIETGDAPAVVITDGEPPRDNRKEAFDMMRDKGEDFDTADFDAAIDRMSRDARKKNKKKPKKEKPKEFEYTSREQNSDVAVMLRKARRISLIKLIICAVMAAGILFLELATVDSSAHSAFIKQGRYGILYILIDLQLLFFSALTLIRNIIRGIKGLFSLKPNTDSLLAVAVFVTAIYSAVLLISDPTASSLRLYSLPAATACLCAALVDYLCCRKDYHCFRVLASKHQKYAALELDGKAAEAVEFTKYLSDSSTLYTVKRTDFCDGFFRRTRTRSRSEDVLGFVIPVIFIIAIILFAVLAATGRPFIDAFASATLAVLISLPLSAFFMVPLPTIRINAIGKKSSSAFVGNAVAEEYADAGVLSFADTEVYPAKNINLMSVKAYGEFRLDTVIPGLARAFALIGGPLSVVLADAVDGVIMPPAGARLIESAADGVCISIDGTHMSIGKRSYLRRCGINAPVDNGDTAFEQKSGAIMYVASGDTVAAKVYLRYTLSSRFNSLLRDMYRAGLCVGIKTLDPNITQEMIMRDIQFRKCPITVLKSTAFGESTATEERIDSGIVTNGSLHTFLKMFALCDKARHVVRSNVVITVTSIFMSFLAVCFLAVTGSAFAISSVYALLFQLVWLIPVWLLTLFLSQ